MSEVEYTPTRDQQAAPANAEIVRRLADDDEESATLLNRLVQRGPDPLSIILALPALCGLLAQQLDLTSHELEEAVEQAHLKGPGSLLNGHQGVSEFHFDDLALSLPKRIRLEAAWIILAAHCPCVEDGYGDVVNEDGQVTKVNYEFTFAERLRRMVHSAAELYAKVSYTAAEGDVMDLLRGAFDKLLEGVTLCTDTLENGETIAVALDDPRGVGPWLAYKRGFQCCRQVTPSGLTFYGTNGEITLKDLGIEVDKVLSPTFGIVFLKES